MKKILITVILIIITSSFASAVDFIPPTDLDGTTHPFPVFQVKLGVAPESVYFYTFGFSNESGSSKLPVMGENNVPEASGESLNLEFDPITARSSNEEPLYFWYKAWTDQSFRLKIETMGNLVAATGNYPEIGWHISLAKVKDSSSNNDILKNDSIYSKGSSATEIRIIPDEKGEIYSAYKLDVSTDVLPVLSEKINYAGTLKLSVEAE